MITWNQLIWEIYPYLMLVIFLIGHIYRFNTNQSMWRKKAQNLLEKKDIRWEIKLFHFGILVIFLGHVVGLLFPITILRGIGFSDKVYHSFAIYFGGFFGIVTFIAIALLVIRRFMIRQFRVNSSISQFMVGILLFLIIGTGIYATVYSSNTSTFDYRKIIGPWVRLLITFRPNSELMVHAPLIYQIHVLLSFALVGISPFTGLIHGWSMPIEYLHKRKLMKKR
ncbi:respiratory nitrate reductase subunit gamma [Neobacillus sp. PS3-40]|uniref:respiratory nitrate reductase subunit gamma n=1 Tax=Neobacillus sp. PS3-40 TaxID=3070679 RepID=UPI0027DF01B7|nr:respiratory nitrate reductase subunit gamma [Neobacillus sp. PS3-40]WML44534.1 respiratory nitrate reductase subunit gamma [Neobacillus sp. PS3-40]